MLYPLLIKTMLLYDIICKIPLYFDKKLPHIIYNPHQMYLKEEHSVFVNLLLSN